MALTKATIAPLVLLSVVDHFKRVSIPRVVGVLLGHSNGDLVNITNSFAIPFEESANGFFFDTSYLLNMFELFYKVNPSEKIVGWYHSGPKMYKNDFEITQAFSQYCDNASPILAIVDVNMEAEDLPVQIYQLNLDKMNHIDVQVGADETEEVGIEHLLRDIKEGTGCSLKDKVNQIKDSLKMYKNCIGEIIKYLIEVENGKQADYEILELLQEIINDMPKYQTGADLSRVYSTELVNSLIAMVDLKKNKLANMN